MCADNVNLHGGVSKIQSLIGETSFITRFGFLPCPMPFKRGLTFATVFKIISEGYKVSHPVGELTPHTGSDTVNKCSTLCWGSTSYVLTAPMLLYAARECNLLMSVEGREIILLGYNPRYGSNPWACATSITVIVQRVSVKVKGFVVRV